MSASPSSEQKSPGQLAYEEDVRRQPTYEDGEKRRTWGQIEPVIRESWEKQPTAREYRNGR